MKQLTCNNCNKTQTIGNWEDIPFHLKCRYGSNYQYEDLDFCSVKCIIEYLNKGMSEKGKGSS